MMVDKCCCCIKLTTGGLILGWLQVVYALIVIVLNSIVIVGYDSIMEAANATNPQAVEIMTMDKDKFMIFATCYLITMTLCLITAVLLIRGVMTRRPKFLVPWLTMSAISIVLGFLGNIGQRPQANNFIAIALTLILQTYFWICIYSLYKLLKTPEFQGAVHHAPDAEDPPSYEEDENKPKS